MLPLVVWYSLATLMPQPSSHTLMAMGTCSTPAAFMVSQKMAFAGAGVADGPEGHLVALVAELRVAVQFLVLAEHFAGLRQAQQARHLAGGGADVRLELYWSARFFHSPC
jgi:hypothetical protein